MSSVNGSQPQPSEPILRPVLLSDLEAVEAIFTEAFTEEYGSRSVDISYQVRRLRKWYGPLKLLSVFPNRFQHLFTVYVAEQDQEIKGVIQVSPFNQKRTTWRVDHLAVAGNAQRQGIGSRLLRYCMEHFREACDWVLEVNIHNRGAMALYRHNGFQPLAQITYWRISPEILVDLATSKPTASSNMVPLKNQDAELIHTLDLNATPEFVRQVYRRDVSDFKTSLFDRTLDGVKQVISHTERVQAYIYEPERKQAIGYFNLKLSRTGQQPHVVQLIVHRGYTGLYPELLAEIARLTQVYPPQTLALASTDYQPGREECLSKLGAEETERTLLMSRSVWHKQRDLLPSFDQLYLSRMLRRLQVNQPLPEQIKAIQDPLSQGSWPDPYSWVVSDQQPLWHHLEEGVLSQPSGSTGSTRGQRLYQPKQGK